MHGRISKVKHNGSRLFRNIPLSFCVVRYHSLVVACPAHRFGSIPNSALRATAFADDGALMACEHISRPHFGVQFHPEVCLCILSSLFSIFEF